MERDDTGLWKQFASTGAVGDYLKYKYGSSKDGGQGEDRDEYRGTKCYGERDGIVSFSDGGIGQTPCTFN